MSVWPQAGLASERQLPLRAAVWFKALQSYRELDWASPTSDAPSAVRQNISALQAAKGRGELMARYPYQRKDGIT